MAPHSLLIVLACTFFNTVAYTAAHPIDLALTQPSATLEPAPIIAPAVPNVAQLNNTITFNIPGTRTSLILSQYSALVSQTELQLCIIEGIGSLFGKVLAKGRDGFLPLSSLHYKYGNVIVNVYDFSAPAFRMTYASVVATLRGIALVTSLYGYHGMTFEVYDYLLGHIGTGDFGSIIP